MKKKTKVQKNKEELKEMMAVEEPEDVVKKKITKNMSREFKCACGMRVRLEGDIANDKSWNSCSQCRRDKLG
jgi:hypothetical protein